MVALKSGSGTWVVPNGVKTIDYLIVGGGGGGGYSAQAGGGGSGGAGEDMVWISDGTFAGTGMRPGKGGIGRVSSLISPTSATTLVIGSQKGTSDGYVYFAGGGGGYGNFQSVGWTGYSQFSPYALSGGYALGLNRTGANSGDGGRGGGIKGSDGVILIRYVIPQVISLGAEATSDTQVGLTWTAPSGTETITGYKVEKSLKGANSWSTATITPDVSSTPGNATTVSGLLPATEYDFRVTVKFASGDGVSAVSTAKTALASQTISWTPTNTVAVAGSDPITPNADAETTGNGTITYSVHDAGTTSCTVDASTGELSFATPGTCVVRATAAETATYASAYTDVSFTILTTATSVTLDLQAATGAPVGGAEIEYTATGLSPDSDWDLVVRSTPQTLASGTVPSAGFVLDTATLPNNLEQGWHSLTWSGTGSEGNTVMTTLWFKVSADGDLIKTSSVEPTEDESNGSMPGTGADLAAVVLWFGLGLLALGLVLIARVRGFKLSRASR